MHYIKKGGVMISIRKTIVLSFVLISINGLATKTKLNLQQAFNKKAIIAKALCTGGLELDYTINNFSRDTLALLLPAGWRFNSDGGKNDYQDVFITQEQIFVVAPKSQKIFHVKGYCCEATKGGPIKGIPFTNGKLADSNLVQLARYLNKTKFDDNIQQNAVWAISDNEPTANVTSANDSVAEILRRFVAKLKGESLPWYTMLKRTRVSNYGDVTNKPVSFMADIQVNAPMVCYSYCYIIDENGTQVSAKIGRWVSETPTDIQTNFKIADLKKGNYKLVVNTNNGEIFGKEFKI